VYEESSKEFKRRQTQKQKNRLEQYHIPSIRSLKRKACPPGQIERKAYVRKYTTAVRKAGFTVKRKSGTTYRVYPTASSTVIEPKCVKDLGLPGKGPQKLTPLRKGELTKHGYHYKDEQEKRHAALTKAIKEFGRLGVFRKLDAVAKLTERSLPEASRIYGMDRDWVRSQGSLKAF
jgi:hypothetical protein